jgi:quercetin dioxygenase-like cupin family protein
MLLPGDGGDRRLAYEVLNPTLHGRLALIKTEIPPGASSGEHPLSHPGEEVVHVLSGELAYWVADELFELSQGDSLTYDSQISHRWRNASRRPVLLISAMTPPLI